MVQRPSTLCYFGSRSRPHSCTGIVRKKGGSGDSMGRGTVCILLHQVNVIFILLSKASRPPIPRLRILLCRRPPASTYSAQTVFWIHQTTRYVPRSRFAFLRWCFGAFPPSFLYFVCHSLKIIDPINSPLLAWIFPYSQVGFFVHY